jgi:hypothetical protein
MTVSAYGLPQFVQTRHTGAPEDGAAVACVCVEGNLRQSSPPGNRNLDKPWFMPFLGVHFKMACSGLRLGTRLGVAWLILRMETEARFGSHLTLSGSYA